MPRYIKYTNSAKTNKRMCPKQNEAAGWYTLNITTYSVRNSWLRAAIPATEMKGSEDRMKKKNERTS